MQKHRSEHRWRDFSFSERKTNTLSLMTHTTIRVLTPKPGFALRADSWRAAAAVGGVLPRIADAVSTVESQRIKTHAGRWAGPIAR